MEDKCDKRR